jgi:outer membrane protein OmpA-like peptidoglycan-associated protein
MTRRAASITAGCLIILCATLSAQPSEKNVRFGLEGGFNIAGDEFSGAKGSYSTHPFGAGIIEYFHSEHLGIYLSAGLATLSKSIDNLEIVKKIYPHFWYRTMYFEGSTGVMYTPGAFLRFSPIVKAHAGLLSHRTESFLEMKRNYGWSQAFTYGFGAMLEYPIAPPIALRFSYDFILTSTDLLDGLDQGNDNDGVSMFSLGFIWSFRKEFAEPPRPAPTPPGKSAPTLAKKAAGILPGDTSRQTADEAGTAGSIADTANNNVTPETISRDSLAAIYADDTETAAGEDKREAALEVPSRAAEAGLSPDTARGAETAAIDPGNCIATHLRVTDFISLSDLQSNPQNLNLMVEQSRRAEQTSAVRFELRSSGTVIASSTRSLTVTGLSKRFDANQFIDFTGLETQLAKREPLPAGDYTIRVSLVPEKQTASLDNEITMQHVDVESIFGQDAAKVRHLINTGKVRASLESSGEALFHVFGGRVRAPESPRASTCDAESNALRLAEPARAAGTMRDAASMLPSGVSPAERRNFIASSLRTSLARAMSIQSWIKRTRSSKRIISIVLAEVYFPFDGAELGEEAKQALEYLARDLIRHPEFVVDVRGFADDIGDAAYNQLLSKRRAERVFEFLSRKQVSETRLRAQALGSSDLPLQSSPEQKQLNRKVQIVLLSAN